MSQIYPWQEAQWRQWQNTRDLKRLAHAVLFYGTHGIGIEDFVLHAGRSLLCEAENISDKPCEQCHACHLTAIHNHPDQITIKPEKDVIKMEQVLALIDFLHLSRHSHQYRVATILNAERMNYSSSNALLKILEEPPDNVVILLSSESTSRLLSTIRSRCTKLRFALPDDSAIRWLAERLQCSESQARSKLETYNMHVLEALDESENNYELFHRQFIDFINHKMSLQEFVDGWHEQPADKIQTWLLKEFHYVLKHRHHLTDGDTLNLDNVGTKNLETLYQLQVNRCSVVNTNPNPRLLLESSLLEWERALA